MSGCLKQDKVSENGGFHTLDSEKTFSCRRLRGGKHAGRIVSANGLNSYIQQFIRKSKLKVMNSHNLPSYNHCIYQR